MLGADFFYTGYFNVTGSGGKWPNGAGPNDPRGYTYQIAMPAYAQEIRTWVPEFFDKGELLNPADPKDLIQQFRFKGKAANELILVRKLGKKYLIYGSIQPNSNIKGNVPQDKQTTIDLEGNKISFLIRRQGSMYVLDLSDRSPVFYQLDGWHQYEHPYYWTKDYMIEAEMIGQISRPDTKIATNRGNSKGNDFTNYTSYLVIPKGSRYSIPVFSREGVGSVISIRAKSVDAASIKIEYGSNSNIIDVKKNSWTNFSMNIFSQLGSDWPAFINISATDGQLELDWIKMVNIDPAL